jgi:hypothetical protein
LRRSPPLNKSGCDQTSCWRRRAAALHVDDENFLTVRLLRKWNSNITDLSIELQSLFKDGGSQAGRRIDAPNPGHCQF